MYRPPPTPAFTFPDSQNHARGPFRIGAIDPPLFEEPEPSQNSTPGYHPSVRDGAFDSIEDANYLNDLLELYLVQDNLALTVADEEYSSPDLTVIISCEICHQVFNRQCDLK